MVESFANRFLDHGLCRWFKSEENTDGCVLAIDNMAEIANLCNADVVSAFDRNDHSLCFTRIVVSKDHNIVDTFVGAFLSFLLSFLGPQGTRTDKRKYPPLESVFVLLDKFLCAVEVFGLIDDFVVSASGQGK